MVGPLKDSNNQFVSDKEVMCEIFKEYFGSVFTSHKVNNTLLEVIYTFDKGSMLGNPQDWTI